LSKASNRVMFYEFDSKSRKEQNILYDEKR